MPKNTVGADKSGGVAPIWVAVTAPYTPDAGYSCIGFYVTGAGTVSFVSGGNTVAPSFAANQFVSADVTTINSGGTATGLFALVI